jgi:CubicO group peptidase (beta-lactamase class C family)
MLAPAGYASAHGGIAAVSRIPNSMEVWWIGQDGSVYDAYWYEGGQWNQFILAPKGSASPSGGIAAVSRMPNTMEVWWVGQDGSVHDAYLYQGGQWNQFTLAPAGSASVYGSIGAVSRIPNSMEVWWTGADYSVQDSDWYDNTHFDIQTFCDNLQKNLAGNSVGYSFSVSYQDQWANMRSGGWAHTAADPPAFAMNPEVKFSTASLSKTVTAAAALQLLEPNRSPSLLDNPIGPYLPAEFNPDDSFKSITFRQLLQHLSGIRRSPDYIDYDSIRSYISSHPNVTNKSYQYQNTNYALFRFLIPKLAHIPVQPNDARGYGVAYEQYVQQHVFGPIGLAALSAQSDSSTGLNYHFPLPSQPYHGWDLGDQTSLLASQGWIMSTQDLAHFLRDLNYSEHIVGGAIGRQMKQKCLGYDACGVPVSNGSNQAYWAKGGFFPGCQNPGEFNGYLVVFSNDVSVALIVNSNLTYKSSPDTCGYQDSDPIQAILDAFNSAIGR